MQWWNPIRLIRKEVPSPGPGPKTEPSARRLSAIRAEKGWRARRNKDIDVIGDDLSSLYKDSIVLLDELDEADDELDALNWRVARGETLDALEEARRNELETRIVPGLRAQLIALDRRIESLERTASRRYPNNFNWL